MSKLKMRWAALVLGALFLAGCFSPAPSGSPCDFDSDCSECIESYQESLRYPECDPAAWGPDRYRAEHPLPADQPPPGPGGGGGGSW